MIGHLSPEAATGGTYVVSARQTDLLGGLPGFCLILDSQENMAMKMVALFNRRAAGTG